MVWSLSFPQTFESQHKCWSLLLCWCWGCWKDWYSHMKSLSKPHSTLFFMPTFLYMIAQLCDNNRTLFFPLLLKRNVPQVWLLKRICFYIVIFFQRSIIFQSLIFNYRMRTQNGYLALLLQHYKTILMIKNKIRSKLSHVNVQCYWLK